jgi:hypothetical protein
MRQDPMIRRVMWLATVGLMVGVSIAAMVFDMKLAAGILAGGLLMFGSFIFGCWAVSKMGTGASRGAAGLVAMKLPILGLGIWTLFGHFEPLAVVIGGSVMVGSIVLAAVIDMAAPVRMEA